MTRMLLFSPPTIEEVNALIVPSITLYEVFKRALTRVSMDSAHVYIQRMREGRVIHLGEELAVEAALVSRRYKLSMADSIIYATSQMHQAELWTQDDDFKALPGVRYIPKPKK